MTIIQNPIKEPESLVLARFQDCDPFGHLNNARFIDYFLNARQDHLLQYYNLSTYDPSQPEPASWVIRKTQIAYLKPVRALEQVLIRTRLIDFSETSLVMEGLMMDKEGRRLKAVVWFEFVHISLTNGRPVKHSEELMRLCRSIVVLEGYDPHGFSRRVEVIQHQFRESAPKDESVAVVSAKA